MRSDQEQAEAVPNQEDQNGGVSHELKVESPTPQETPADDEPSDVALVNVHIRKEQQNMRKEV